MFEMIMGIVMLIGVVAGMAALVSWMAPVIEDVDFCENAGVRI